MKDLINIDPFELSYRVFNKANNDIEYQCTSLYETFEYAKAHYTPKNYNIPLLSFTLKREQPIVIKHYNKPLISIFPPPEIVIQTNFGDIVSNDEIRNEIKRNRKISKYDFWKERNERDYNLLYTRKNRKKLKAAYRKYKYLYYSYGLYHYRYSNVSGNSFRKIKTFSEARETCGHQSDYGENIIRAKRGYKTIPSSWDDVSSGLWKKQYSWKHNSKRRKQWIPT